MLDLSGISVFRSVYRQCCSRSLAIGAPDSICDVQSDRGAPETWIADHIAWTRCAGFSVCRYALRRSAFSPGIPARLSSFYCLAGEAPRRTENSNYLAHAVISTMMGCFVAFDFLCGIL